MGWVGSEMDGPSAPRTTKQATESILWLAMIGTEGPSGGLFRNRKQIPWQSLVLGQEIPFRCTIY
jgi:hypothetical protein